MEEYFSRSRCLFGDAAMEKLSRSCVAVVGIGGVGSWCAEALVRTGVGNIIIMDDDIIAPSNVNRQCPATAATVSLIKVEAMAKRLREIAPAAKVVPIAARFNTMRDLLPGNGEMTPDIIVDAIDSVRSKAELVLGAHERGIPVISSLGAALRFDPCKVKVGKFSDIRGEALARALRRQFESLHRYPKGSYRCVYSTEPAQKREERGSIMTVTATFGMVLADFAIKHIVDR